MKPTKKILLQIKNNFPKDPLEDYEQFQRQLALDGCDMISEKMYKKIMEKE